MSRYWVIAQVESKDLQLFIKVWRFYFENNLISIGWSKLDDILKMSREALSEAVAAAYPDRAKGLVSNMLWAFYHEIGPGDFVIARRGRKTPVGVGGVVHSGFYSPGKNPFLPHPNFLEVEWQTQYPAKDFQTLVFRCKLYRDHGR